MSVATHTIQRLLPRHYAIVDLAAAGHKYTTIGEMIGMNPQSVSLILRSPLVQAELSRRRGASQDAKILGMDNDAMLGKARSILEKAAEKAAKTVEHCLDDDDGSLRLRAANSILDRVFGKADEKSSRQVLNITSDQTNLLVLAIQESHNGNVRKNPNGQSIQDVHGTDGASAEAPIDELSSVQEGSEVGSDSDGYRELQEQGLIETPES